MKSFFPAVLSFAIFFIACGDNSSSVSAANSHNENSSLFSSSDTPMSNDGETSEFSSSAKSSSNSAKSSSSEDEQGDGGSEAAVTSSSSVVSSSSDTSTSSSSEEKSKTSSSSVETDAEIMPLGTYDCTEHKCLTTEFLNQDFLEAGKYSEILDQKSDIVYKVIKIGDQWWTAQNVYNPFGTCFDDMKSNCDIYGSNLEKSIANNLHRIMGHSVELDLDLEEEIAEYEKVQGVTLHPAQKEAITAAINSGCVVISGGPGTGKTTIIKFIIELLKKEGRTFALTAPTGRAAKRMSEATGAVAKTIHRLLELHPAEYSPENKLDADVVIVDEISMADEYVFNALLKAIPVGGKIILVGDKDQLPSVGAGNILADIISSGIIPVKYLTHIYRQSADSNIAIYAHMINAGNVPEFDNRSRDFFFDNVPEEGAVMQDVISLCTERLPRYFSLTAADVQVLAPLKKGDAGVESLNAELQKVINPPDREKGEMISGERIFRVGDRVIHTVNNYQLGWIVRNGDKLEAGEGVFNGDIGKVVAVARAEAQLQVQFEDGKVATYTAGDLDQLSLAYAISVHKSQGSEFPVAVVVISRYNPIVTSRNLLYTAITRAKRAVVLVGDKQNVVKMIKNNYTEKRHTALSVFLKENEF